MQDGHLRLVSRGYRRRVLDELVDHPVIEIPDDVPHEDDQRERVHVRLYHCDLPQLDAADLVDWDRNEGTVRRGPAFDEVRPLLRALEDRETEAGDAPVQLGGALGD